MTDRELMQQVYQYLTGEAVRNKTTDKHIAELISEWLAQPEQEPLTDEEIYECERVAAIRHQRHKNSIRGQQITSADNPQWHFARAIERAHGIGGKE